MGVISANDYVPDPSLTPAEIEIIRAYIADPSRLLGPELMSAFADNVLMGLVIGQTWTYYSHYSKDHLRFRILVGLVFAVSLAQSISAAYMLFVSYGTRFGDWHYVESFIGLINFRVVTAFQTVAGTLSQIFFLERAVVLIRLKLRPAGWVLLAYCAPSILAGLALGLAAVIIGFAATESSNNYELIVEIITAWKALTIATDVVLTATLLTCLYINRTGRRTTDSLLGALSRGVIEAQTLPLLSAIFFVIALAVDPSGNFACIPAYMEGKLATLSVLHVLNSRTRLRDRPFVQSIGNLADFSHGGEGALVSGISGLKVDESEKGVGGQGSRGVKVGAGEVTVAQALELDPEAFRRTIDSLPRSGRRVPVEMEGDDVEDDEDRSSCREDGSSGKGG